MSNSKPSIQSIEERLMEIDRVILETSQQGCELLRLQAPVSEVDVLVDFLRTLYQRRDVILFELRKQCISEKRAYEHIRERRTVTI